jgi:hypothetical protein
MTSFAPGRSRLVAKPIRVKLGLLPKALCALQRVDSKLLPPSALVAVAMKLAVMKPAQRNGIFIAYFSSHRALLGEPEVMRIGGTAAASQAGLGADKFQVVPIAPAQRLA